MKTILFVCFLCTSTLRASSYELDGFVPCMNETSALSILNDAAAVKSQFGPNASYTATSGVYDIHFFNHKLQSFSKRLDLNEFSGLLVGIKRQFGNPDVGVPDPQFGVSVIYLTWTVSKEETILLNSGTGNDGRPTHNFTEVVNGCS